MLAAVERAPQGRKRLCSSLEQESDEENQLQLRQKGFRSQDLGCSSWLAHHGLLAFAQQQAAPQCALGPQFWWALAELNVTLAAYTHLFEEQRLLESHSFTRCPRAVAFEKLCFARGCASDAASLADHPLLQAAGLVLDTALTGCSDAAISQVALHCPPFLQAWAARWLPPAVPASPPGQPRTLRLLIIQGYRPHAGPLRACTVHNLGLPTIVSTPAAATVYLPCA